MWEAAQLGLLTATLVLSFGGYLHSIAHDADPPSMNVRRTAFAGLVGWREKNRHSAGGVETINGQLHFNRERPVPCNSGQVDSAGELKTIPGRFGGAAVAGM